MDKYLILSKIKEKLNIKTDRDFADFLEINPTTLAMWKARNTFDIELLFKKCEWINANWLLTGEGNMLKNEENTPPQTPNNDKYTALLEVQNKNLEAQIKEKDNVITILQSQLKDKDTIIKVLEENKELLQKQLQNNTNTSNK